MNGRVERYVKSPASGQLRRVASTPDLPASESQAEPVGRAEDDADDVTALTDAEYDVHVDQAQAAPEKGNQESAGDGKAGGQPGSPDSNHTQLTSLEQEDDDKPAPIDDGSLYSPDALDLTLPTPRPVLSASVAKGCLTCHTTDSLLHDLQKRLAEQEKRTRRILLRWQMIDEAENELHFPGWSDQNYFDRWVETTTLHGPSHALQSRRWLRKCWIGCCCLFTAILAVMIFESVADYLSPDSNWGTSVYEVLKDGATIEMPNITFCHLNRINYKKAKRLNISIGEIEHLLLDLNTESHALFTLSDALLDEMLHSPNVSLAEYEEFESTSALDVYNRLNMSMHQLFDCLALSCEEIMLGFNTFLNVKSSYDSHEICSARFANGSHYEVDEHMNGKHGKCFSINFDPAKVRTEMAGPDGGMVFLLDMLIDDTVPLIFDNPLATGILVQIDFGAHDEGRGVIVTPGVQTAIAVEKQNITFRTVNDPVPFNNAPPGCRIEAELEVMHSSLYSVANCHIDCELLMVAERCGCADTNFESQHYAHCGLADQDCVREVNAEKAQHAVDYDDHLEECTAHCLPKCQTAHANTRTFTTKLLPTHKQREEVLEVIKYLRPERAHDLDEELLMEDLAVLNVYMSSMSVHVIERFKKNTLVDLLSQIGGIMGLWMGASVMTIIHTCIITARRTGVVEARTFILRSL